MVWGSIIFPILLYLFSIHSPLIHGFLIISQYSEGPFLDFLRFIRKCFLDSLWSLFPICLNFWMSISNPQVNQSKGGNWSCEENYCSDTSSNFKPLKLKPNSHLCCLISFSINNPSTTIPFLERIFQPCKFARTTTSSLTKQGSLLVQPLPQSSSLMICSPWILISASLKFKKKRRQSMNSCLFTVKIEIEIEIDIDTK